MADEETSDLEVRDLNDTDDKPYLTRPNSQIDLESRLEDGAVLGSDISSRVYVNPNPYGDEDYAGTDPIYQNHANDTEAPLAAEGGADEQAETAARESYGEVKDGAEVVTDPGMGGEAVRAADPNVTVPVTLVPGQEGYPDNPEQFTGPTVTKSAVEDAPQTEESKGYPVADKAPDTQPSSSPAAPVLPTFGNSNQ